MRFTPAIVFSTAAMRYHKSSVVAFKCSICFPSVHGWGFSGTVTVEEEEEEEAVDVAGI